MLGCFFMIWCGATEKVRQRPQSMLRIVAVRGPKAPQPRQNRVSYGPWGGTYVSRRRYAPKNTQQVGLFRPRRAGACPRRRYGFAGMRRSSLPRTARRHTQVPPYIPGRSANMVRRAGPMCPAAGTHQKTHNRLVCSDHVGRGLAPAAGTGSPECAGHRYPAPPGGTRRCRPTSPDGVPIWSVGRDLCVPPLVRTKKHTTGWFVPAALCDMVFKY